jgi:hypothetical protein
MTSCADCASTQRLAGAIALGEADDAQREAYRSHLSMCGTCLREFGGEREIERVMSLVSRAREDERWEPALRLAPRRAGAGRGVLVLASTLAALAIVAGIRTWERPGAPAPSVPAIASHEAQALAALDTRTGPKREARAESLAVGSATYAAGLEITVDEHGHPQRCRISTSSGDRAFDVSICRAAMHARYTP